MPSTKHDIVVIIKERDSSNSPTNTAPKALVAGNVMPSNITEIRIAPIIPAMNAEIIDFEHLGVSYRLSDEMIYAVKRYTTAIPKTTHKNAGVTVIIPVIVSTALTIPITTLEAIAIIKHSFLLLQFCLSICFSPPIYIMLKVKIC
ncbi:MAG: hypothetical protein IKB73_05565 [Ruminococcus sp.]|nr:hypothetical protein [Ruminococcus sp.]